MSSIEKDSRESSEIGAKDRSSGRLLSKGPLRDALEAEKIFISGSWSPDSMRQTAYDLRFSGDFVSSTTTEVGSVVGTQVVELKPGESIRVSTAEKFAVDWNYSGTVGPKFALSLLNISFGGGYVLDPGYGYELTERGDWEKLSDERMHFTLTNLGQDSQYLRQNDAIATLQIYEVEADPDFPRSEVVSYGNRRTLKQVSGHAIYALLERELEKTKQEADRQSKIEQQLKVSFDDLRKDVEAKMKLVQVEAARMESVLTHSRSVVDKAVEDVEEIRRAARQTLDQADKNSAQSVDQAKLYADSAKDYLSGVETRLQELVRNASVEFDAIKAQSRDDALQYETRIKDALSQIRSTEQGASFVATFGVYLVCVTLLGISINFLVELFGGLQDSDGHVGTIAAISGIVGVAVLTIVGFLVARKFWNSAPERESRKKSQSGDK